MTLRTVENSRLVDGSKIDNLPDDTQQELTDLENQIAAVSSTKVYTTVGNQYADYITDGTDDEVQIMEAIEHVNNAGGGTVYIQPGTYNLGARVYPKYAVSGVKILANGVTLKAPAGTELSYLLKFAGGYAHTNIVIDGLGIDGNSTAKGGIEVSASNSEVKNCKVTSLKTGNGASILIDGSAITKSNVRIQNNKALGGGQYGINIITSNEVEIVGNDCQGATAAIRTNINCDNIKITQNTSNDSTTAYGIYTAGSTNVIISGNNIKDTIWNGIAIYEDTNSFTCIGNVIDGSGHSGIACSPAYNGTIIGNKVTNVTTSSEAGIELEFKSLHVADKTSHDITVTGNQIDTCYWGIVTHNRDDNDTYRPYNINVANNEIADCTNIGLYMYDGDNVVFNNNLLEGNTTDMSIGARAIYYKNYNNGQSSDMLQIETNGTLRVGTANYETLVTDDNDIPNKKYVDDNSGGGGGDDFRNGFDLQTPTSLGDITFDDATRTLSVAVKSGESDFHFWCNGTKFTKTSTETVTIPDVTATYYIYFDNSGVIQYVEESVMPLAVIYEYAIVSLIYWNATAGTAMVGSEQHGIRMSASTHAYNHLTYGARYDGNDGVMDIEGLSSGGSTYTQTTSGHFWDEDIRHAVSAQSTHKFLYKLGATGEWTGTAKSNEVSLDNGGSYDVWNEWDGSTWKLTEGTSSTDFWIIFYIATPNISGESIVKLIGQNAYSSRYKARNAIDSEMNNIITDGLPSPEFIFLYATIVKRNGTLQALADGSLYLDLRKVKGGSGGASESTKYGEDIPTDVTDFDNILSSTDTNVQLALDTLDDGVWESLETEVVRTDVFNAANSSTWADIQMTNKTDTLNAATGINLVVDGTGGVSTGAGIAAIKRNATANQYDLAFMVDGSAAMFEGMRLTKSGYLGIGTTSAASQLHTYVDSADVASSSTLGLTTEQDGTGDAVNYFLLTGTKRWTYGIDNSDSDAFKISKDDFSTAAIKLVDNKMTLSDTLTIADGTESDGYVLTSDASGNASWQASGGGGGGGYTPTNNDTVIFSDSSGNLDDVTNFGYNSTTGAFSLKGVASQTADMVNLKNSSGTELFVIEDDGRTTITSSGAYGLTVLDASGNSATFCRYGTRLYGGGTTTLYKNSTVNTSQEVTLNIRDYSGGGKHTLFKGSCDVNGMGYLYFGADSGTGNAPTRLIFSQATNGTTAARTALIFYSNSVFLRTESAYYDAGMKESTTSIYLDESSNKLKFKSKYSDGTTIKYGGVPILDGTEAGSTTVPLYELRDDDTGIGSGGTDEMSLIAGGKEMMNLDNTVGTTITVDDDDNIYGLKIEQNDVTNNPIALSVTNASTGEAININQTGVLGAYRYGLKVSSNTNQTNSDSGLLNIHQDNSSSVGKMITMSNDGVGYGIEMWQNGVLGAGKYGLGISSSAAQTNSELFYINSSSTSSTANVASITNAGTGDNLFIDHNNSGSPINIDQDANDANACYGIKMNIANAGSGVEYAFKMDGSEIVSSAVGGTQNKKIRVDIAGTTYYIPLHTA